MTRLIPMPSSLETKSRSSCVHTLSGLPSLGSPLAVHWSHSLGRDRTRGTRRVFHVNTRAEGAQATVPCRARRARSTTSDGAVRVDRARRRRQPAGPAASRASTGGEARGSLSSRASTAVASRSRAALRRARTRRGRSPLGLDGSWSAQLEEPALHANTVDGGPRRGGIIGRMDPRGPGRGGSNVGDGSPFLSRGAGGFSPARCVAVACAR